jgi:hypothetical protein
MLYNRNTEQINGSEDSNFYDHDCEHLKIRTVMKLGVPQGITLLAERLYIILCRIYFFFVLRNYE